MQGEKVTKGNKMSDNLTIKIPKINKKIKIGLFLLILKTFLSYTRLTPQVEIIDTILSLWASLLFIIVILEKRYPIKTLVIYLLILVLGLITAIRIGNVGFGITVITCLAIREEKMANVVRFIYGVELVFIVCNTVGSIILSTISSYSLVSIISGVERYNFGMSHPNIFSALILNLILMWIYINFANIQAKNIFVIFAVGFITYMFTRTRTFIVVISLICIMVYIVRRKKQKHAFLNFTAKWVTPIMATITYVLVGLYLKGNAVAIVVDKFLSSRIKLAAYAIINFGVTLFGENLSVLSNVGLIWLVVICMCFYLLAKKMDTRVSILIIAWALYGMSEVHGINCYECFPILLCASLLPKTNKGNLVYDKRNSSSI